MVRNSFSFSFFIAIVAMSFVFSTGVQAQTPAPVMTRAELAAVQARANAAQSRAATAQRTASTALREARKANDAITEINNPDVGLPAIQGKVFNEDGGIDKLNARLNDPKTGLAQVNTRLSQNEADIKTVAGATVEAQNSANAAGSTANQGWWMGLAALLMAIGVYAIAGWQDRSAIARAARRGAARIRRPAPAPVPTGTTT